uniref:Uncharacterized protein n=1 Tax=Amphimedon queenslandica TaxID=400682 RepID=A0A1X7TBF0_AMPQE
MAQIEFDEGTGTFPYFIVLLYGIFLLVITYFLWSKILLVCWLFLFWLIYWAVTRASW